MHFLYGIFAVGFGSGGVAWEKMTAGGKLEQLFFTLTIAFISLPLVWLGIWLIKKDSFGYTHYPIRFNRKNRTVHGFRIDGTIFSTPWDDVFFTLGHLTQWDEWEVRGHVVESDRVTVRETFVLSYVGSLSAEDTASRATEYSSKDFVRAHWEFVRRFMEDGPESVLSQVQFCMPLDGRRENIRVSVERVLANFAGASFLLYGVILPFCLVVSAFRVIAMRTSKIPEWTDDVEKCCVIDSGDPYAIAGGPTGERIAVFPEAAAAAGACYCAPLRS
jgi:hypothetical protein